MIGDAWTAALEAQAKAARQIAADSHAAQLSALRASLPLDEPDLKHELRGLRAAAMETFNLRCRGTRGDIRLAGEAALNGDLAAAAADAERENAEASLRTCKTLLFDLMDADPALMQHRDGGGGDGGGGDNAGGDSVVEVPRLWAAWDACVEAYEAAARGPAREAVLLEHGLRRLRETTAAAAERGAAALQKTSDALEVSGWADGRQ